MVALTGMAVGISGVLLMTGTRAAGPFVAADPETAAVTAPAAAIPDPLSYDSVVVTFAARQVPATIVWRDMFDTAATGQLTQATGDPLFAPTVAATEDADYIKV